MISPKSLSLQSWSSVGRWTVFGTMACVAASIAFTLVAFADLSDELGLRLMACAAALPIIIGAPLFFYFSVRMRGLAIANARLGRVARTDSLTACLNRGAFTDRIDAWLRDPAAARSGALLVIDADNFKTINDLYGHDVGDEALTVIARAIRSVLRNGDIVGRMGGEEFGVFLPGVTLHQAQLVADRIRLCVNFAAFQPQGEPHELSVSIGGAVFTQATSFAQLFRIADQRLYGVKHAGRNATAVVQVEDLPVITLKRIA